MSSDARLRQVDNDGWEWAGNHDGPCISEFAASGTDDDVIRHHSPLPLVGAVGEMQRCLGSCMRWRLEDDVLRGWCE